jgi:hypothetical protein
LVHCLSNFPSGSWIAVEAAASRAAASAATSMGTFVAPLSIRTTVAMPRFILEESSAKMAVIFCNFWLVDRELELNAPTPSFVGVHYTDDLIVLDVTFIQGRPKETRLALLKDINTRVAAAAGVSPDDMMITLCEVPGENISFGRGEAQRAKQTGDELFTFGASRAQL